MIFGYIDPQAMMLVPDVEAENLAEMYVRYGINPMDTYHHVIKGPGPTGGVGILVDIKTIFAQPPDSVYYFAYAKVLYAGNGLLYQFDVDSNMVDLDPNMWGYLPPRQYYGNNLVQIENEIATGALERPVYQDKWAWPEPLPDGVIPAR